MKKALYLFAFAVALVFISSCSRVDEFNKINQQSHPTYSAVIGDVTRTALQEDGSVYHVNWAAGDMIAISDGNNTSYYKTQDSGKPTGNFTFASGLDPDGVPTAYYPSTIVNELPAVQTYTPNNIARSPMIGLILEDQITFKNLCGILKLNVSTTGKGVAIKTIEISADQPLCGEYEVDFDGKATITNGEKNLTINCPSGLSLSADPKPLYIALPEGTYTNMTFKVTATNRSTCTAKQKKGQPITIERSKVHEGAIQFNNFKDGMKLPVADLFDIMFNQDGTAMDVSASALDVQLFDGPALVTIYDDLLGRYVAHFNHNGSLNLYNGYYRADYTDGITAALPETHSLECLFCSDITSEGGTEYKMFSTMQSGGTGFLVSKSSGNTTPLQITFLPYVGSGYIWTGGEVLPEAGHWYHVIGVYDKANEETRIYVNGEFIDAYEATGDYKMQTAASRWFCVGGDASATIAQNGWKGEVAIARAYSKAITDEEAMALYEASHVGRDYSAFFAITGISFPKEGNYSAGEEFAVTGNGIEEGDFVCFESITTNQKFDCQAEYDSNTLTVKIPAGMTTDTYCIWVCRGERKYPVGKTSITI